jgi:hypothetical protein
MGIARKLLIRRADRRSVVSFAQFFEGTAGSSVEFSLPADLTTLSAEELEELSGQAVEHFNALYGDGTAIATDSLDVLSALTDAIEALATEKGAREAAFAEQQEAAAALAARVKGTMAVATDVNVDPDGDGDDDSNEQPDQDPDAENDDEKHGSAGKHSAGKMEGEAEAVAAEGETLSVESDRRPVQIRIPARSGRQARQAADVKREVARQGVKDVVFASGDGLGVQRGAGMDFAAMGRALDTRLKGFNLTSYAQASAAGRELREVGSFAAINRKVDPELTVMSNDRTHIAEIIARATAVSKMTEKKSLLASGGWNAASEVLYNEFLQLESATAGILSIPEIGIARGGAQITPGVSFANIYAQIGFTYTEAEDISGEYDLTVPATPAVGPKPVYHLTVPNFTDHRLGVSGLIIEAGLLAARGYPEYLADVIRKALVAHAHKVNGEVIADIVAGSTAVTMPATQQGAAAPILSAIELQAQHYRSSFRMDPNAMLEGAFPVWVVGAIRSDLSRRLGVDLISVPDARILAWFSDRHIAPQFVYDWQPIETTAAGSFTAWPTTVSFLLYSAGQWVKGVSDVITMDTLYDSALLRNNDYTALFTEEGWFAAKVGTDSRVVTTGITPAGQTAVGVAITSNGTLT